MAGVFALRVYGNRQQNRHRCILILDACIIKIVINPFSYDGESFYRYMNNTRSIHILERDRNLHHARSYNISINHANNSPMRTYRA